MEESTKRLWQGLGSRLSAIIEAANMQKRQAQMQNAQMMQRQTQFIEDLKLRREAAEETAKYNKAMLKITQDTAEFNKWTREQAIEEETQGEEIGAAKAKILGGNVSQVGAKGEEVKIKTPLEVANAITGLLMQERQPGAAAQFAREMPIESMVKPQKEIGLDVLLKLGVTYDKLPPEWQEALGDNTAWDETLATNKELQKLGLLDTKVGLAYNEARLKEMNQQIEQSAALFPGTLAQQEATLKATRTGTDGKIGDLSFLGENIPAEKPQPKYTIPDMTLGGVDLKDWIDAIDKSIAKGKTKDEIVNALQKRLEKLKAEATWDFPNPEATATTIWYYYEKSKKKVSEEGTNRGEAANRGGIDRETESIKKYAYDKMVEYGFEASEWDALDKLVKGESEWNPNAKNPNSSAYGLFQFIKGTWSKYGKKTDDPEIQIQYGLKYIQDVYETPSRAWAFWRATVKKNASLAPKDLRSKAQQWIDKGWAGY